MNDEAISRESFSLLQLSLISRFLPFAHQLLVQLTLLASLRLLGRATPSITIYLDRKGGASHPQE